MTPTTTKRPPLTPRKRIAFTLGALAIPFLALALLEGALRLAGFGGYHPLFQTLGPAPNGGSVVATDSRGLGAFFFRNPKSGGTFRPSAFIDPKPANTFRVLLIGGSAVKGYPHTRAFAPSTFLEAMLADAWPDKAVEVINLGCTAAASFPALEILRAALRYEPDLVVVYSGHNEFFGAYGVASLNTVARSHTTIVLMHRLRSLAIVQAADALVRRPPRKANPDAQMLMDAMVGESHIAPNDPIRLDAADNLRANITAMVAACARHHVPVIVCTLPVNERGLAPLGVFDDAALATPDRTRLEAINRRADSLIDFGVGALQPDLEWATKTAPDDARAWWLLARALDESGKPTEALAGFQRAVDLDPMPWRATSSQNDAIRAAAATGADCLADVQAAFRAQSPEGATGWEFMVDHVHMSIEGEALAARAIVDAMATIPDARVRLSSDALARVRPTASYVESLGASDFEHYAVAYRMSRLFELPFFADTNAHAQRLMDDRLRALDARMTPDESRAADAWRDPKINPGYTNPISAYLGRVYHDAGRYAAAAPCFRVAMNSFSPYTQRRLEFATLWLDSLRRAHGSLSDESLAAARDAAAQGQAMLALPDFAADPITQRFTGKLELLVGAPDRAIGHLLAARASMMDPYTRTEIDMDLIDCSLALRRPQEAVDLITRVLDAGTPDAAQYRERLREIQSTHQDAEPER